MAPTTLPLRRDDLVSEISTLPWFHQMDLGNGIITPGAGKLDDLMAVADAFFDPQPIGKTVLDIGCYDGFYSFEAKRRGAGRVLATDHYMWRDPGCRRAFEIARACLAPTLEDKDIDVLDLTPQKVGTFDVVLFAGVLYHLRNPFLAIEQVARLTTELLILETHLDAHDVARPAMIFYPTTELNNDPSNWWGPNEPCVTAMLKDVGFRQIRSQPHPVHGPTRRIFHAAK